MAEKIKVINPLRSKHTVNLKPFNGKEFPINGGGFTYLTDDEVAYIQNTSKAFEKGFLKIANPESVPDDIDVTNSPDALTDEDILNLLKKPQKQIEIVIANLTNVHVVKRILELANEQDKSVKVVEAIQARVDELIA